LKYINYSISEILEKRKSGNRTPEMLELYEKIDAYQALMEGRVQEQLKKISELQPDNAMRWIQENVPEDIRRYVCCGVRQKEYNVLYRSERKWKTLADIGLEVETEDFSEERREEWLSQWRKQAAECAAAGGNIYESHAHYNLKNYNGVWEELRQLLWSAGVQRIVIPAIEYTTNRQILEQFDAPGYENITYAFGSHPKYIWKETWEEERWREYKLLLQHEKCVAVGEAGLDYSYAEICEEHREKQMEMFRRFIHAANEARLPMILHLRPADEGIPCDYDVVEDALQILRECPIQYGAVVHCFGGTWEEMQRYMEAGVTAFGIGGRITYGNKELEEAVRNMPEEAILLETDAPYIKLEGDRKPNTSLILTEVAEKIAAIRGVTREHVLAVTFFNGEEFFYKQVL